ncbi:hypothetical protein SETIT_2G298600v2 [Setaria italica]|uniref:Uncharacterized protein n=1 Tax=Setaria italica TaxID=4555 RepID=A0A368Q548_SETIT|nr:hypothetical protein SETIT_2G298600v2 [Setaria italica]
MNNVMAREGPALSSHLKSALSHQIIGSCARQKHVARVQKKVHCRHPFLHLFSTTGFARQMHNRRVLRWKFWSTSR